MLKLLMTPSAVNSLLAKTYTLWNGQDFYLPVLFCLEKTDAVGFYSMLATSLTHNESTSAIAGRGHNYLAQYDQSAPSKNTPTRGLVLACTRPTGMAGPTLRNIERDTNRLIHSPSLYTAHPRNGERRFDGAMTLAVSSAGGWIGSGAGAGTEPGGSGWASSPVLIFCASS